MSHIGKIDENLGNITNELAIFSIPSTGYSSQVGPNGNVIGFNYVVKKDVDLVASYKGDASEDDLSGSTASVHDIEPELVAEYKAARAAAVARGYTQ